MALVVQKYGGTSVADAEKSAAFLKEAVGFEAGAATPLGTHPVVAQLLGLPGAQWRMSRGKIPGTTADFGLIASGLSPDGSLVEICEVQGHPFMVGTQFHPEFRSRPDRPHPLFRELIRTARAMATRKGEPHAREQEPATATT